VLDKTENPFVASSLAALNDFMSIEDIANESIENLINFLVEKVKIDFLTMKLQPNYCKR